MLADNVASKRLGIVHVEALRGSLIPFLYQTRTIQRTYSTADKVAIAPIRAAKKTRSGYPSLEPAVKNKAMSRNRKASVGSAANDTDTIARKKVNHVPFDGLDSTNLLDRTGGPSRSTMTPRELLKFHDLFRMQKAKVDAVPKKPPPKSLPAKPQRLERPKPMFPDILRPLAEEAQQLRAARADTEADRFQQGAAMADSSRKFLDHVKELMDKASQDTNLWEVIQVHLFQKVKKMGDRLSKATNQKNVGAAKRAMVSEFQTLADAIPELLLHYLKTIQQSFPGSSLGLILIPNLKKLGPSAYALGATTDLYNQHMRILYEQYADLDGIANMLSEMDAEVYEFNDETRELLREILQHAWAAEEGHYGPGQQAFWTTDRKTRALEKLRRWDKMVKERITAATLRNSSDTYIDPVGEEAATT